MLPPLFQMDDYETCIQNENLYCKLKVNLQGSKNNSEVWKYIEDSIQDVYKFRRDILWRNLCIPKYTAYNNQSIKEYSYALINKEIRHLNLTSSADVMICTNGIITRSYFDYYVLIAVILYGFLVAFSTLLDVRSKNIQEGDRTLRLFSLRYNWQQRTHSAKNEDNKKLTSMQGFRFYTTILLLLTHTKLYYSLSYYKNPASIEKMLATPLFITSSHLETFLVLIFFVISSWLLTNQICNIREAHGKFTLKQVFLIIINRYFRLVSTVIVLITLLNTSWFHYFVGPNNFDIMNFHLLGCKKNWHATILFFNNIYDIKDMCVGTTWYLSADFQMYVAHVMVLYISFKYNFNLKKVFLSLLFIYYTVYGLMIYINDTDLIFKTFIRNFEYGKLLVSHHFNVLYLSTYSIWLSSWVGMILGSCYFKICRKGFSPNNVAIKFSIPLFFILTLMAIGLTLLTFRGITSAILGPLVKLFFASGIGMGILGMSQNLGGMMKKIFEWKPAVTLSNFTFCIYLCQISICFMKPSNSLVEFGIWTLAVEFFKNVLYSISIGILFTLTVEEPLMRIQKIVLPQVSKSAVKNKKKSN
ncbi:O-acyltransferase like protein [Leptinotarsa decemlineata]|uniref:O-acyltransferase like protein n=1 Tax=Leptinotarsa decemlineata TaxID=7539 RepID=UPI003D3078DB